MHTSVQPCGFLRVRFVLAPFMMLLISFSGRLLAQTDSATLSGRITDATGAVIEGAEVVVSNDGTGFKTTTLSNESGVYVISDLHPGAYQVTVDKNGFRRVVLTGLLLNVQDALSQNFTLAVGPSTESVTVIGNVSGLQTDSGVVSTLVDQQFVGNMPLNGRSFQPLIASAPGVVFTSQNLGEGQFSVNGQRSDANYFMVDGVSANLGLTISGLGQTLGGAIPSFTAQGGTNGMVSVDAMQEFRIDTSSYEAEFGRTPGAQISIITKSGGNQFHGTAFDYLRNDAFDARNYFDAPPLPKPAERQNDFGGTVGGPIRKDKTFFFFSYEGLRLRLPQTATGEFFTASARAAVAPVYQPIVNALPLPSANAPLIDPTCDNVTNPCLANLTAAYSNPSSLNATSIRIDQNLGKKITLFARYLHAPSFGTYREWEELAYQNVNTDSITAGVTMLLGPTKVNDFRANWSRYTVAFITRLTDFYGGVPPPTSLLFPASSVYRPGTGQALVYLGFVGDGNMDVREGTEYSNVQRQLNFVDTFSWAVGVHQIKFGIDYRRINPTALQGTGYSFFPSEYAELVAGTSDNVFLSSYRPYSAIVNNYSLFAQDTWRVRSGLTLTYGLRWEINTPPESAAASEPLYVLQGIFNANPPAEVPGALWHTKYNNFAPRIGVAYQVTPKTVVRGGFGVFYDLGYGNVGYAAYGFPYSINKLILASPPLPFDPSNPALRPPPFSTVINQGAVDLSAVDPNLRLPYTLEWNAAIERQLGLKQTLTASYVGADGRRLLRQDNITPPAFLSIGGGEPIQVTRNAGYSHYDALQVQFQRRISQGLQALVSYTLAKSSDVGSTDAAGLEATSVSNIVLPPLSPSDFDIRNSFTAAISYEMPTPSWSRTSRAILGGWAVDGIVRASSAPPINVTVGGLSVLSEYDVVQPNIVPGQRYWIADPTQPDGKALNPAAFVPPPTGENGNFLRNGLRSPYSIDQTDLALRRQFRISERVKLDVRVEYFNVFNHPMFGLPGSQCNPESFWGYQGGTANPAFGKVCPGSTTNVDGAGSITGQNALYALGGPRSAQFTLKLHF
jgi:Carboxypeptidase regulatory-like domain/TonB dependent receptor